MEGSRRFALALSLLALMSFTLVGARDSSSARMASASKACGTVGGEVPLYDVTSTRVTCRLARKVARRWEQNVFASRCTRFSCASGGFRCRAKPPARVRYRVRCSRGARRVSFEVVVDK